MDFIAALEQSRLGCFEQAAQSRARVEDEQ